MLLLVDEFIVSRLMSFTLYSFSPKAFEKKDILSHFLLGECRLFYRITINFEL